MLSEKIIRFLFNLQLPFELPANIEVLDVYKREDVKEICTMFYRKFYNDSVKRSAIFGINPGRFGSGITGISFTDPIRLQDTCGIPNSFRKKQELSSVFMYEMMEAFGGVSTFYKHFYISAVSPLGFIQNQKNLNYYDNKLLLKNIEPFVRSCLETQLAFNLNREVCFCIGERENFKYFSLWNSKYNWFKKIKTSPHPRFIMQYKLKLKDYYLRQYVGRLAAL